MQINNGIDIIYIPKIKKILTPHILNKLFTSNEQEYFQKKSMSLETIAGFFAAKEAFLKSLNQGIDFCKMTDIEILHDKNGSPYFNFHQELKKKVKNITFSLSISHDHNYAIASVIALSL